MAHTVLHTDASTVLDKRRLKATRFICVRNGEGPSPLHRRVKDRKTSSMRARRWLRIGAAALTGIIALSAYAGVIAWSE
jgi:hypothetical protein